MSLFVFIIHLGCTKASTFEEAGGVGEREEAGGWAKENAFRLLPYTLRTVTNTLRIVTNSVRIVTRKAWRVGRSKKVLRPMT